MPRKKASVKKTRAGSWAKNVSKSFGALGNELIKEMAPGTYELVDSTRQPLMDLRDNLKDLRGKKTPVSLENVLNDKMKKSYQVIKEGLPNIKADLKSGNFYNVDRLNEVANRQIFGDDGGFGDIDVDLDFGDIDDFGDDFSFDDDLGDDGFDESGDSSPTVVTPNITINSNINANNPMVKVLQETNHTLVESQEAAMEQSARLASIQMVHDSNMIQRLETGMATINDNLSLLVQFHNDNTNKLIIGALDYFTETKKTMGEWFESYKNASGLNKNSEAGLYSDRMDPLDAVGLGFNMENYIQIVKDNFKRYSENNMLVSSIKTMAEDSDYLESVLANPIGTLMKSVTKSLIPGLAKKAIAEVDRSVSAVPAALLMQLTAQKNNYNSLIMPMLSELFGINLETSKTVDMAKFDRGPMPFNGITQKYITEVIPGYLAKMTAALTGTSSRGTNEETGITEPCR